MDKKWKCIILLVALPLFISLDSASAADGNGTGDGNIGVPVFPPPVLDPPPSPYDLAFNLNPTLPPYDQSNGGVGSDPGADTFPYDQPIYPPPYLAPPVFPLAETDYYMARPVKGTGQERAWCSNDCGKTLTCPAECPLRVPSNSSVKGCFIHCSQCEATCKWRNLNCDNYGPSCYSDVQPPSSSPLGSQSSEPPPAVPDAGSGSVTVSPPTVDPPPSAYDPPASDSSPTPPTNDQFNGGGGNDPGPDAFPVLPPPYLAPPVFPLAETDYYMTTPVNETGQEQAFCYRYMCSRTLTCPVECPFRVPSNNSVQGCFIDCSKCEATCKWRDPNCNNYGPICYGVVEPPPPTPPGFQSSEPPPALPDDGNIGVPVPFNQPVYPPPSLAPPVFPLADTDYYMAIPVNETGQEQAWCFRDCGKTLTCPVECPYRVPNNISMKGCFIDCSNCEATCKWRTPNCENYGPSCYGVVQSPPSSPLVPDAGSGGVPVFPPPVDAPQSPYNPPASDSPPSGSQSSEPPPTLPPPSNYPPTTNSNDYYMVASVERTGQEQAFCYAEGGCHSKTLTCPAECPYRKPTNRTMKECNIDCSTKCEATCKWRMPLCDNFGSLCYDPRFVGGDGNMFYFHGFKGGNFAIVTDDNIQINAHFIGHRPPGKKRDLTWVQALSIMFDSHTLTLAAKRVSKWDDKVDVLLVKWDNQWINIPTDGRSEWRINSDNRVVVIERTDDFNTIRATVSGLVQVDTKVVPIGEHENKVHHYHIPADDAYAHLETQFKFFKLSDTVEGVLGKTYQPGYISPIKMGQAMPVLGGEDKYQTPSLSSPLCKICKFKRPSSNSIAMVTAI